MNLPDRSLTVLIAALGGEGGGVMADWLMQAATARGYPAQATSIPGVAQRTGATTYYLEIYPVRRESLGRREPVMSLTPSPGNVDVMVASELLEAGRALQNGYVTPDRTTLIASTHRIYATAEKMQMADGRFPEERVLDAARQLAKHAVLFDMRQLAQQHGTVINAVLFGAMAGAGVLPLPREACEAAIRRSGRGAEASLRGFAAGFEIAAGERAAPAPAARALPPATREIIDLGAARLRDYQGEAYAQLFLARVASMGDVGAELVGETARALALWMSYEDIIRVADLKTRPARFARVRREAGAGDDEPLHVIDHLKPGVEELASLLPPFLGRRLQSWAERNGKLDAYNVGMRVKTSGVFGYLLVRSLAWLKPWRPSSYRYAEEQALIERWLAAVRAAAARHPPLALEIAACAGLLKGYGETHRRGKANFLAILDALVENPATADPAAQAEAIRKARAAALADPEQRALERTLGRPVTWLRTEKTR
ncbi:MAG: 2-oxoacid:acceptor oxidoreductase family protein [Betaproteobacteria bacterium]|nr:2-oxoacid:acceptor oxidoreductase family protein [Betaproteobacteria bacterium]MDH5220837.1 2-oxoacid:acceptor oxidoreductase family protein [Betaproteobacteria bacterium]MDH5349833.1 2-oxoacid:acceptor oxidoreductase family protein [Betaproteobacteria bacterium]